MHLAAGRRLQSRHSSSSATRTRSISSPSRRTWSPPRARQLARADLPPGDAQVVDRARADIGRAAAQRMRPVAKRRDIPLPLTAASSSPRTFAASARNWPASSATNSLPPIASRSLKRLPVIDCAAPGRNFGWSAMCVDALAAGWRASRRRRLVRHQGLDHLDEARRLDRLGDAGIHAGLLAARAGLRRSRRR